MREKEEQIGREAEGSVLCVVKGEVRGLKREADPLQLFGRGRRADK